MTKRQSETEPVSKTVVEVAHALGGCAAVVRFKRLNCSQGHGSGALLLPGRRARDIAGYGGRRPEVTARKARYYGRVGSRTSWRAVMRDKGPLKRLAVLDVKGREPTFRVG
jgi:hypothetical protein